MVLYMVEERRKGDFFRMPNDISAICARVHAREARLRRRTLYGLAALCAMLFAAAAAICCLGSSGSIPLLYGGSSALLLLDGANGYVTIGVAAFTAGVIAALLWKKQFFRHFPHQNKEDSLS